MIDSKGFIKNSLICEYGYIINLDTGKLECWLGYQREPDTSNRYGTKPFDALGTGIYYPCRNVMEVKLEDIQNGFVDMARLLLSNRDTFIESGQQ